VKFIASTIVILALSIGAARADTTVEEHIAVNGVGMMSFANMSGTSKTIVSGDRSRRDSDMQMESRLVRMLARNAVGPTAEIVRLDEDKIYHLEMKKKQYTEMSFEQMRAQMQQAEQKMQESTGKQPSPVDDSQCEWSDPKADVKRTGEKMTIAGYSAERLTVITSQACTDKKTGSVCEMALALDEWLAPEFSGNSEASKFQRAYAQKLGLTTGLTRDLSDQAKSLFGRYKGVWSQVVEKMKDVKGYPVKSSFAFAFGGPKCSSGQQPQQQSSAAGDSSALGGGLASQLGSKLAGAFSRHRKEDTAGPAPAATQTATTATLLPDSLIPIITMTSELVSVSNAAAPADAFGVPADFKKITQ
jgi:hypothetical protein